MFSICKSESKNSGCSLLDLEPLKYSIAERPLAKETLALIQELRLSNFLRYCLRSVPQVCCSTQYIHPPFRLWS